MAVYLVAQTHQSLATSRKPSLRLATQPTRREKVTTIIALSKAVGARRPHLNQFSLFGSTLAHNAPIALTADVSRLLAANCVVAIGVSGGKDSQACALAVDRYLKEIGHSGERVLIHSDLGRTEWKDSLPSCKRLAAKLGWELLVEQRKAGDMLARWQVRWTNNVARYRELRCVRLILPWSTSVMRFCTSELKTAVITSALRRRYPEQHILNVTGIRRQESPSRATKPVSEIFEKLCSESYEGWSWNPIIEWRIEQVFQEISRSGLELHEAYTRYDSSRVSCAFCILSSGADLLASARCHDNHDLYREMVELEALSTFAFQGNRWLGDVAPHLLPENLRHRLAAAKVASEHRRTIEATIPKHLLYVKGWPTIMPTPDEATLIASVRQRVSALAGIDVGFLTGTAVSARYAQLMEEKRTLKVRTRKRHLLARPTQGSDLIC